MPRCGLLPFGLALLLPAPVGAQVRASEPASVSQTVDGTKLTVSYSRPRARTRDSLFGKVVTWGEVWTPGANLATTLELSKDVRLEGHAVPKGKYSVWLVVRAAPEWTLVLDPRSDLFHMAHPESTAAQIRFPVRTAERPFAEVLTWSFPEVRVNGMTVAMQWGTIYVPLNVEVEPSYRLGFPAAEADRYVGSYAYRWKTPGDSGKVDGFIVTYENGMLMGRWDPVPYPEWARFALIRIKDDWFIPGFLDEKGVLFEVAKELIFEFNVTSGRASGLDVRGEDDNVMATATRKS
jgi:DUF2911 family protein